jgi:hypothetical protein
MRTVDKDRPFVDLARPTIESFDQLRQRLRFDRPAILVASSESPREQSEWSGGVEAAAEERLRGAITLLDNNIGTRMPVPVD